MSGVLLIADASGEQVPPSLAELAAEGARLASELGADTPTCLLAGSNLQATATSLGQYGVGRVLLAESPGGKPPSPQWLLAAALEAGKPEAKARATIESGLRGGAGKPRRRRAGAAP